MKRTRRDNLERTSSTRTYNRSNARAWSRSSFGASALLATAMLLLSFANCANAVQPAQNLHEWNVRWAVLSSALGETLGTSSEAQTRAQGEQLWRWMQSRVAAENSHNISPLQVARWLHEWQAQRGVQTSKVKISDTSSTRSPFVLASQLPQFSLPQRPSCAFSTRRFVASLPSHTAAKLSGVRSNRNHE